MAIPGRTRSWNPGNLCRALFIESGDNQLEVNEKSGVMDLWDVAPLFSAPLVLQAELRSKLASKPVKVGQ